MQRTDSRPKSHEMYEKLCSVIPGGVNSPVRACQAMQMTPIVAESAQNDMLTDHDGFSYIDYCMSWGALIHGHAHPEINRACLLQMQKGTSYGATSAIEHALAEKIVRFVPSCQKVRFVSSGTEATMSAVRLARGYSEKPIVVTFSGCFHGHADYFLVQAGSGVTLLSESSSKGIPKELVRSTIQLPYNDEKALDNLLQDTKIASQIACFIIEPIAANMGVVPATKSFLKLLRQRSQELGAVLIFDEVISGFRVTKGGAQELYGVIPDLTCFGKIVGGGFPLAGFGGKAAIMDFLAPIGPVYQSGTLSGNPVAAQAGLQALQLLEEPELYTRLKKKAEIITEPVREFLHKKSINACIQTAESLFTLFFGRTEVRNFHEAKACDQEMYKRFFQFLFNKGIFIAPLQFEAFFVSDAHTQEHLIYTRDAILEFLTHLTHRGAKGEFLTPS